jgi:cytochrome c oxidase subunit 3
VTAAAGAHALEGEATRRVRINRLGLWLFLFSDGLVFALLGAARFYMNGTDTPEEVDQTLGLLITSILLVSSLTAYRAETAFSHGNRRHGQLMLLATIALGLIFIVGVGFEWSIAEFVPSESYGTSFFSMTGMHAAHVGTGILFLAIVYWLSLRGRFGAEDHWGVSGVVMWWHFVDVVWVFFYPILYLVS